MSKKPPIGPAFSKDREFAAILGELRSEFRVFGETLTDIREKVTDILECLEKVRKAMIDKISDI